MSSRAHYYVSPIVPRSVQIQACNTNSEKLIPLTFLHYQIINQPYLSTFTCLHVVAAKDRHTRKQMCIIWLHMNENTEPDHKPSYPKTESYSQHKCELLATSARLRVWGLDMDRKLIYYDTKN
jgi:hypothetical protein